MDKKKATKSKKEDDSMSVLTQYLETNRERAYSLATSNTKHDKHGHPVISKDDEWIDESEWDDLFDTLADMRRMEK